MEERVYTHLFGKSLDEIKNIHKEIRQALKSGYDREVGLFWGLIRGFKYRRMERSTRTQMVNGALYTHNKPRAHAVYNLVKQHSLPITKEQIQAWLDDPTGAIPAPPPRVKRPYLRPEEAAAE